MVTKKSTSNLTSNFPDITRKSMGERIRQLWVQSGELQDVFAKQLGVSTVTLSNYMGGKRKPDSEFLLAIKNKLNICIDWLLTGDDPIHPGELAPTPQIPSEQTVISTKTVEHCPRCERLETELEEERRERRELSVENRKLWKENGELKERCATLVERQKTCCQEDVFKTPPPIPPNNLQPRV